MHSKFLFLEIAKSHLEESQKCVCYKLIQNRITVINQDCKSEEYHYFNNNQDLLRIYKDHVKNKVECTKLQEDYIQNDLNITTTTSSITKFNNENEN